MGVFNAFAANASAVFGFDGANGVHWVFDEFEFTPRKLVRIFKRKHILP
ncbi:MAG: hypothetical protein JXR16_16695 [Bermanella sp.]